MSAVIPLKTDVFVSANILTWKYISGQSDSSSIINSTREEPYPIHRGGTLEKTMFLYTHQHENKNNKKTTITSFDQWYIAIEKTIKSWTPKEHS